MGEVYNAKRRKEYVRWVAAWMVINSLLCAYIFVLLFLFWDAWTVKCIRRTNVWLLVYMCI